MTIASFLRGTLLAALTTAAAAVLPATAHADGGFITLTIYKAGWIIGGSGGSGVLNFHGRAYPLSTGGLDYGLVFGGSRTVLRDRAATSGVRPMSRASMAPPVRALPSAAACVASC